MTESPAPDASAAAAAPQAEGADGGPVRLVFLAGMGRSGTTLLERALAELDGTVALGEVLHLWERGIGDDDLCGCGQPFSRCPFWTEVGRRAFGSWESVDLDRVKALRQSLDRLRFLPRIGRRDPSAATAAALGEYSSYYTRLYEAAAAITGRRILVDSSKQVSLAYCLAHDPAVELRVVHCVRDSRGVSYSWTREVTRPERADGASMPRYSPAVMSLKWDMHNLGVTGLPRLGVPVLRLRYEDLVADPVTQLGNLARFVGAPFDRTSPPAFVTRDHLTLGPSHTVSGNPMRFLTGRVDLRLDDAWRTELAPSRQRLVTGLTFPLLAGYGYRVARGQGTVTRPR